MLALALLAPVPALLVVHSRAELSTGVDGLGTGGIVPLTPFLPFILIAGLAWGAALLHVGRRGPATMRQVLWILIGSALLRGLGWTADPGLSNDRHRYVFEGALVLEGQSPWAAAPDSLERAAHRERWPATAERLNHPDVPAAYPPVMQWISAGAVALGGSLDGVEASALDPLAVARRERFADSAVRAVYTLLDLAVLLPLGLLLRARGRSLGWLLAWGACPLVLLAFSGSGHFDSAGVLLMMTALALWDRGLERGGRVLLALGIVTKFLPGLVLVGGLGSAVGRKRAAWVALVGVAVASAALLLEGGYRPAGLSQYALRWQSTPGLFRFVEPALEWTGARDGSWSDPRRVARLGVLLVFAAVAWHAVRLRLGGVRSAALLLFAFCLLSPTLHPWYVTWLVPFVGLVRNLGAVHLILAAPLLYWPAWTWKAHGVWADPGWLFWVVFAPALLLALVESRSLKAWWRR